MKKFKNSKYLGDSSSRRPFYDCKIEYAKSGISKCRLCRKLIEKNLLRIALMIQDDEGYKNTHWLHKECFWKHKETKKVYSLSEIYGLELISISDKKIIEEEFNDYRKKLEETRETKKSKEKVVRNKKKQANTKKTKKNKRNNWIYKRIEE